MAKAALISKLGGPSAIPIHDDGNMPWYSFFYQFVFKHCIRLNYFDTRPI
jgi:hypothetical protein